MKLRDGCRPCVMDEPEPSEAAVKIAAVPRVCRRSLEPERLLYSIAWCWLTVPVLDHTFGFS